MSASTFSVAGIRNLAHASSGKKQFIHINWEVRPVPVPSHRLQPSVHLPALLSHWITKAQHGTKDGYSEHQAQQFGHSSRTKQSFPKGLAEIF